MWFGQCLSSLSRILRWHNLYRVSFQFNLKTTRRWLNYPRWNSHLVDLKQIVRQWRIKISEKSFLEKKRFDVAMTQINFEVPKVIKIDLLHTQFEDWKNGALLYQNISEMRQVNYASHFDSSARVSEVRSKIDWNAFHQKRRGQA